MSRLILLPDCVELIRNPAVELAGKLLDNCDKLTVAERAEVLRTLWIANTPSFIATKPLKEEVASRIREQFASDSSD